MRGNIIVRVGRRVGWLLFLLLGCAITIIGLRAFIWPTHAFVRKYYSITGQMSGNELERLMGGTGVSMGGYGMGVGEDTGGGEKEGLG